MSYQQVLYRKSLEGSTVASFMNREPISAPGSITIRDLMNDYIYRYHFKMFPVRQGEKLLGCVTTRVITEIPQEYWDRKTVSEVMDTCAAENSVSPDTSAMKAFSLMGRTGKSRLMVVENDRLVGVIALKDIMRYLAARIDMERAAVEGQRGRME
jgi:CBS domain-containing protein